MNLSPFIASLMPSMSKATIEDEFDALREIHAKTSTFMERAYNNIGKHNFKSSPANRMLESLDNRRLGKQKSFSGFTKNLNFIGYFNNLMAAIGKQLPIIESMVDKYFEEDNSVHALNLQRINFLQYVPILTFIVSYARSYTNYAISIELNILSNNEVFEIYPAESNWINKNFSVFIEAVEACIRRSGDIEKIFEELPDLLVSKDNAKTVSSTIGSKGDPMGLGFIPVPINPFYYAGQFLSNYQAERYHLANEELKMLERKVHNLKIINEGRNDAKIQKEIAYTEDTRIRPLREKVAKMEEEYVNKH